MTIPYLSDPCLVLDFRAGTVRHIRDLSNARSMFTKRAMDSGDIYFISRPHQFIQLSNIQLLSMWENTYLDFYKKLKSPIPDEKHITFDEDEDSYQKLWDAWIVTYPIHDIWDGVPVVNDEMEVIAVNERTQRNKKRAQQASKVKPKPSKEGPWKLTKHVADVIKTDKFKQRRVIVARLIEEFGTEAEFTKEQFIRIAEESHKAGEYRVSAKTTELGDFMYTQIVEWHVSPMVRGGMMVGAE